MIHPMLAFVQYLTWAERMRAHFDGQYPKGKDETIASPEFSKLFMYCCYWFAGFHVVLEGYRQIGIKDSGMEKLLDPVKLKTLKRYRNGVYHFQPDYFFDPGFTNLFSSIKEIAPWLGEVRLAAWSLYNEWSKTHDADGSPK